MSQLRQAMVEQLKSVYTTYYDVTPVEDGSALKALCAYHLRDSQYVLVKKAELWAHAKAYQGKIIHCLGTLICVASAIKDCI